ncbi:unnamed protein product, partial [Sphagnum balticum]
MQWLTGKAQPEEEYSGCEAAAAAAAVEEDVSCKVVQQQGSTTQASASCTSSEILDADSPRTIDSGLNSSSLQTQLEDQCKPVAYPALQIIRPSDTLLDQSANADSSSTYLPATQVEEHGALSWWDWPF